MFCEGLEDWNGVVRRRLNRHNGMLLLETSGMTKEL